MITWGLKAIWYADPQIVTFFFCQVVGGHRLHSLSKRSLMQPRMSATAYLKISRLTSARDRVDKEK